jgi:hypothetical protein
MWYHWHYKKYTLSYITLKYKVNVDLAFASNARFLDNHKLHSDNMELYKFLSFAVG